MGGSKLISVVALLAGLGLLVLSLLADRIGLGGSGGFGYAQITGLIVGGLLSVVGLILLMKKNAG